MEQIIQQPPMTPSRVPTYAGFWKRFAAYALDKLMIAMVVGIMCIPLIALFGLGALMHMDENESPIAFLLAMSGVLIMFAIIWKLRRHRHAEGWLFGVYCVLAGIERFIVEFFRAKDDRLSIGITEAQLIALAAIVLGVALLYLRRNPQRPASGTAQGAPGQRPASVVGA